MISKKNNINQSLFHVIMSAKQRRVNGPPSQLQPPTLPLPPSQTQQQQVPSSQPVNMTLPQVLQMMEARIRKLEQVEPVKEPSVSFESESVAQIKEILASMKDFQTELIEYDSRFNILATEMNQLKDIVLKLQTYTMDVNKRLLEERGHMFKNEEAPL